MAKIAISFSKHPETLAEQGRKTQRAMGETTRERKHDEDVRKVKLDVLGMNSATVSRHSWRH